jgi:NTE family protein
MGSLIRTRSAFVGPYCVLSVMLAAACPLQAQHALVLSGGAARGLAHVGAIEYLDELGYDADLVVGTSMGAVVGALYAAGYEPDEIRQRVLAVRWDEMFDATPIVLGPDRALRVPVLAIDLNVVRRFRARHGLFGQWRVNRALAGLLLDANARSRGDFDRLPRRYRAVAADLKTGETVVLDSGDVALAVRASMAFPGFFASVEWGDRTLVDGGVADNFPTSAARELGADYIVGVDVTRPPDRIGNQGPFNVVDRTLNLMLQNLQRTRPRADALITPIVVENFAGPSFPVNPIPLMNLGYDAARRDLASAQPPTGPRAGKREPPLPASFSRLVIEAPDSALAAFARTAFNAVIGRPYDADAVLKASDRLFATGLFEAIWPRVVSADSGADPVLLVRLEAPPRLSLSVGAHFENDRGGRAWGSVDAHEQIAGLPAVITVSGSAGSLERWGTMSLRLYGLSRTAFALSTGAHVIEREVRFFADDAMRLREVLRGGGWAGIEFPHVLKERLVVAIARAEHIDVEDGAGGFAFGPLVRLASSAAESRVVGLPLLIEAERRWGDVSYSRGVVHGSVGLGGKRGPQLALGIDVRAVSSDAPDDVKPALGDEHAIPGLRWGEFRGRARAVGVVDVAIPVRTAFARLRARTGAVSSELDELDTAAWVTGGQLGIFWRTPIGILEAGYGLATRGDGRFEVSLGRGF